MRSASTQFHECKRNMFQRKNPVLQLPIANLRLFLDFSLKFQFVSNLEPEPLVQFLSDTLTLSLKSEDCVHSTAVHTPP